MITFKQFIAEIFNGKGSKVTKHRPYDDEIATSFKIGKHKYYMNFEPTGFGNSGQTEWDIAFESEDHQYDLHGEMTTGQALQVYNTVIAAMKKFLKPKLKQGDYIRFHAVEERTKRVYHKFAVMAAKEVNGTVTVEDDLFLIKVGKLK